MFRDWVPLPVSPASFVVEGCANRTARPRAPSLSALCRNKILRGSLSKPALTARKHASARVECMILPGRHCETFDADKTEREPNVSGKSLIEPAAAPLEAPAAEPQSPLGKVGAKLQQAGSQAAAMAGDVAEEARSRGASLGSEVKEQIVSAADSQRKDVAAQISDVADAVHQAGEHFKGNQDWIARIVENGAEELGTLASTLRTNDLQGLLGKLQDLARRQPAVFVGAAMAAGFAAVRLGRVAVAGASEAELPSIPEVPREPK
jgi:hypothetical protein